MGIWLTGKPGLYVSAIQMLDNCLVFKAMIWKAKNFVCYSEHHLNNRLFNDQTNVHDLNTRQVSSDRHCSTIFGKLFCIANQYRLASFLVKLNFFPFSSQHSLFATFFRFCKKFFAFFKCPSYLQDLVIPPAKLHLGKCLKLKIMGRNLEARNKCNGLDNSGQDRQRAKSALHYELDKAHFFLAIHSLWAPPL